MSESESDPLTENTSRFSRGMIARVSAVGLFVVLGTFAVIQSMGSASHDDEIATTEELGSGTTDTPTDSASANIDPELESQTKKESTVPDVAAKTPSLPDSYSNGSASTTFNNGPLAPVAKTDRFSPPDDNGFGPTSPSTPPESTDPLKTTAGKPPTRYAQGGGAPLIGSKNGFQTRDPSSQFPGLPGLSGAPENSAPDGQFAPKQDSKPNSTGPQADNLTNNLLRNSNAATGPETNFPALPPGSNEAPALTTRSPKNSPFDSPPNQTTRPEIPTRGLAPAAVIGAAATGATAMESMATGAATKSAMEKSATKFGALQDNSAAYADRGSAPRLPIDEFSRPNSTNSNPATDSAYAPNDASGAFAPTVTPARPLARQPATQSPYGQPMVEPRRTTAIPASTSRLSNHPTSRVDPSNSMIPMAAASLTKNIPGDRQFEGVQAPAITIEKLSPREIQVNRTADFQIVIKNVGRVTAEGVRIFDQVPSGTEFISASPEPTRMSSNRDVEWNIGKLRPGQEKRIRIKLKPVRPGEIGSVAHFTFSAQASMRTLVTKPVLEITHQTKQSVLIGDDVILDVLVKNKGDGPANNVLIQEDVPKQLEFQDGYRELEYEIGTLMPGQSRQIRLALKAANVGKFRNVVFATGDGGLQSQHGIDMEIIAPQLVTQTNGPTRRFLQRNVTHQFSVVNQGTATATNVELIARLPAGLRFISANNQGRYVADKHAVYWSLPELARAVDAKVELKTVPVEVGNQPIKFEAFADLNTRSVSEHPLSVEHHVDVSFSIDDVIDPIEIGAATHYQIRIVNQGTKTATNVQFQVDFPQGIQPTSVDGSLKHRITGQTVLFDPINSLAPGDEISVVVYGTGTLAGDHRVVLTMKTDGRTTPVSREETTQVYSDR